MKTERVYVVEILDRIGRVEAITARGRAEFFEDFTLQNAALRILEVIGEAVKRISTATRDRHESVPWRGLARLRDVVIHQYDRLDLSEVWRIVTQELVGIRRALEDVLSDLTARGE